MSTMQETIEPEVWEALKRRARGKCECENFRCKHVAKCCRNRLDSKSRVALPGGMTTTEAKIEKGRHVCLQCFQRSDSFYRQQTVV